MLFVGRYCLFVITLCILGVMMAGVSLNSYANNVKVVPLKYRDAGDVKKVIAPLLSKGSAISIDNNSVILSAPDALMKKLIRTIKAIDKPKVQLQLSIFRGKYPDKQGVKSATTDTRVNQSNTIYVEEGQTVVVTDNRLLKVEVGRTDYANNTGQSTAVIEPEDTSVTTVVVNDGILEASSDDGISLGELALDGQDRIPAAEVLTNTRSELVAVPTGLHIRVTLTSGNQARVAAKVVSAVDPRIEVQQGIETIELSSSVETLSTFALNTWSTLSESVTFTHRPALNAQRKVYSTETVSDKQQSIWVKVKVLP